MKWLIVARRAALLAVLLVLLLDALIPGGLLPDEVRECLRDPRLFDWSLKPILPAPFSGLTFPWVSA